MCHTPTKRNTSISYGELKNKMEDVDKHIKRITKPVFDKVLKETPINHTLVGKGRSFSNYNLHNYRLYFRFDKKGFNKERGSVRGRFLFLRSKNYDTEMMFEHVKTGTKVTTKKTQIEVRYKNKARDWHLIDNSDPDEITRINDEKREDAVRVLGQFVKDFGGSTDFQILNEYKIDNTFKDNTITEKQNLKHKFETDVVKKLYNEKKLEYKNELYAKNFAHNTGLYDFSPVIAGKLDMIEQHIMKLTPDAQEPIKTRLSPKEAMDIPIHITEAGESYDMTPKELLYSEDIKLQSIKARIFGNDIERMKARLFS